MSKSLWSPARRPCWVSAVSWWRRTSTPVILLATLLLAAWGACGGNGKANRDAGGGPVVASPVVIAVGTPRPRTGNWSVNYWTWPSTYGNAVAGTETLVAALEPTYMRVGGYNNDANVPDPFDDARVDDMITYARA